MERMVQKPISHACLVDVARFRIGYLERLISAVPIGMMDHIVAKRQEIVHEMK